MSDKRTQRVVGGILEFFASNLTPVERLVWEAEAAVDDLREVRDQWYETAEPGWERLTRQAWHLRCAARRVDRDLDL